MVSFFGDYDTTETVVIPFNTFTSDDPSASATITNLAAGDVEIHKDGSTTQRASDNGVTVTIDFDSVTGNHIVSIDLSDNSDAGFYAAGSRYQVRVEGTTVDGATINAWIGAFSIGCTLRPATDGRTVTVDADGHIEANVVEISDDATAADNLELACDNYSATRGLSGTALPAAAADAAGGLPVSDAGGLDLDTQIGANIDAILTDTGTTLPGTLATIEGKIDTVDGVADAVLVDTGTTLPATLTTIEGKIDTVDGVADAVLVDTGTTLPATLATIEGKIDTVDGIVDSILVDTAEIGAAGAGLTEAGGTGDHLTAIPDGTVNKNAALSNFTFLMVDSTDHVTPKTGLTVSGQRSLDAAAFASVSGAIAEISNGWYQFDAAAADTNGDFVAWRFTATGADDVGVSFKTK